jgi:hypothetical protein
MIFHDFEEHSGNYVTKNQGKSDRCPAFAADSARVRQAVSPNVAPGDAMIVPGWAFPGGFPTESMTQAIGEEENTG